jgi:hypothetical protein
MLISGMNYAFQKEKRKPDQFFYEALLSKRSFGWLTPVVLLLLSSSISPIAM